MTIKMSVLQEFDLSKINFKAPMCRFCLKHNFSLQKLFKSENSDSKESTKGIVNKIFVSTGLKIQPDDKLPNLVCKTCLSKLAAYLDFRNQCLEANRILNIAIFKGSDSLHNEESAYNVNFTEAETDNSDCEEDVVYNQSTADLFKHVMPKGGQQAKKRQQIIEIAPNQDNSSVSNKKFRLEIIDRLNHLGPSPKSEIQIISDIKIPSETSKELEFDDEDMKIVENPQQENLTVGLELEIRSDNSPARKQVSEQIMMITEPELFSIEPANINLTYDCEKGIPVLTENEQNDHDSDSGITTESSGCTVIKTNEDPVVIYGKRKSCHKCSYCGILTSDLTNHLLTHQKNKPTKTQMSQDEIPEGPFSCTMCERNFLTDGGLRVHIASHTREKNFVCPVCNKSCAYKYTLSSHLRIHGIYQEIFSCDICDKTFRNKGEVLPHKELVHNIEMPQKGRRKPRGPNKKQKTY